MALPAAWAQDSAPPSWRDIWKWRELWAGVDASRDNWLVYSGATVAPFGHIHEDGFRLRVAGGYGGYAYSGDRSLTSTPQIQSFAARVHFIEALAGYLAKWGPLTAKAFAGVSVIGHSIGPFDPENAVLGEEAGLKGVVELWLNLGDHAFASLDAAWNSAHDTRNARARVGYRVWPQLSAGLEAWLDLDAQSDCDLGWETGGACGGQFTAARNRDLIDYTRGGLFLRYEWDGGEVSVSGGISGGSFMGSAAASPEPYMTVNWITQF